MQVQTSRLGAGDLGDLVVRRDPAIAFVWVYVKLACDDQH
jgi:hypothetical protein